MADDLTKEQLPFAETAKDLGELLRDYDPQETTKIFNGLKANLIDDCDILQKKGILFRDEILIKDEEILITINPAFASQLDFAQKPILMDEILKQKERYYTEKGQAWRGSGQDIITRYSLRKNGQVLKTGTLAYKEGEGIRFGASAPVDAKIFGEALVHKMEEWNKMLTVDRKAKDALKMFVATKPRLVQT